MGISMDFPLPEPEKWDGFFRKRRSLKKSPFVKNAKRREE
jgi:hypothetical protein